MQYINGLKKNVMNDEPVIGPYGVNREGSGDMYYKGALMLNTIRHILNDDERWWRILKEYNMKFRHSIVTAEEVIDYFSQASGLDLHPDRKSVVQGKSVSVREDIGCSSSIKKKIIHKTHNVPTHRHNKQP